MATYQKNHLRFLSILIFALCALCTIQGAVPSTPLAYYTPSASLNMTRSGNGDPNDEPYTVIVTEAGRECVYTCKCTQKEEKTHFFAKKFGHLKKKQYLCAIFRVIVRRIPEFEENIKYILQCQKFVKLQARKPWADATFRTRSVTPNARLM